MTIGILGGGQLGRMIALAGYTLGQRFVVLDPSAEAPAGHCAPLRLGGYDDERALTELARKCDVVTYEFENVPVASARFLSELVAVAPPPRALEVSQDRLLEKRFFEELGIRTPKFQPASSLRELEEAVAAVGLPAVVKTRRFGYDGKGQRQLETEVDVAAAWDALSVAPLIVEALVPFEREVSVLSVRGRDGEMRFWPLIENAHAGGVLRKSVPLARGASPALTREAEALAERVLSALDYVGVLAIELFVVDGALLANEMAPRVHNSGHWTIEGAETSQFENHVRALAGMPLGSTALLGPVAMVNVLGRWPDVAPILRVEGAHLHAYGKEPSPGRKLGHVTVRAPDEQTLAQRVAEVERLL